MKIFSKKKQKQLKEAHLFRSLRLPTGLDFCSNDYLSLSENPNLKLRIKKKFSLFPLLGSGGSRLLRGHSDLIENLESKLAKFSQKPSALFFPTGYQANLALFSALLREQGRVFSDQLVHASIIDGIRLSGGEKHIWSHNNLDELEVLLKQKADSRKMNFVVVESVYSMEGDFAPLKELDFLCAKYHCHLIVDEAHATGLFGKKGSGQVEELNLCQKVFARIHTGGKALGVSGAWIAGSTKLINFLINLSRPFIYSTAPASYQQLALLESIDYFSENQSSLKSLFFKKVKILQENLYQFCKIDPQVIGGKTLSSSPSPFVFKVKGFGSPITSFVVGRNETALKLMEEMSLKGYDIRAIRPPTVPVGQALLRLTVPLKRSEFEIEKFIKDFKNSLETISSILKKSECLSASEF